MSWVRFNSVCQNGLPPNPLNEVCPDDKCPGSDVYIFDIGPVEGIEGDMVECCGCAFGHFMGTEEQMLDHIDKHLEAGHHIRPSLMRDPSKFNPGSSLRNIPAVEYQTKLWAKLKGKSVATLSELFKAAEELNQELRK